MRQTTESRPSLLSQQLTVLGMAPGDEAKASAERQRIEGIELAPLALGGPQKSNRTFPALMALAAVLALTVVSYRLLSPGVEPDDGLRMKGSSKVWVYWERDGMVEPWSDEVALQNGDRVRAEVLAGSDAMAYLAVTSGDGILLGEPSQVALGAVKLAAGERKTFPGSFKLVGADEKERLVVIVCHMDGQTPDLSQVLKGRGQKVDLQALPQECGVEQFMLRGGVGKP